MSLPSANGWGSGWPNPDTAKIVALDLPGFGAAQRGRQELTPLVEWLITETERRGYHIRPDWTWGFSNRPVRGTEDREEPVPSDHSWGTAWDINAPVNGMNYAGRGWAAQHRAGKTDMPEWLPELWKAYGFEWGGDFGKRQDPMHMQFGGTPADAARYVAKLNQPEEDMTPDQIATLNKAAADAAESKRMIDVLYEQLIGTKDKAGPEALRQLFREDAADSDAVEKRTRPKKP
jgi:hypothetical protein